MKPSIRLTLGLPVYNGAQYLEATLQSLQRQTYGDYLLIISDNASTDRTEEICRTYASMDSRIQYFRNSENIGAVQNWYRVFDLCSSELFASVAHDDQYAPEYMSKCIEVLDRDPSVVLCYSKTNVMDEAGRMMGRLAAEVDTTSPWPHRRLYNVIATDCQCIQLYGVMRSNALRRTKVFAGYYGCDRNTLAELALMGVLHEIPEYLFFHRMYPNALGAALNSARSLEELITLDPGTDWRYRSTYLTIYRNYYASVSRLVSSLSEQIRCYWQLTALLPLKAIRRIWRWMQARNVKHAENHPVRAFRVWQYWK